MKNVVPPDPDELAALLRLLDDQTPVVRARVTERIALFGGDLSEWLAAHPRHLSKSERSVLIQILQSPRREALERDWLVPTGGAAALSEDWDTFEALLRVLSDFLHDGITIRQPLSDALDLLAEEADEAGVTTSRELRAFLFSDGRFIENPEGSADPRNSDLAWSMAEGRSNPIGLCIIFILVGRRMDLVVEGVNFPGHFLCRIYEDAYPIIIDCADHGRMHLQSTLLEKPDLDRSERNILRQTADPGAILIRVLNNLLHALEDTGRKADRTLIRKLRETLKN